MLTRIASYAYSVADGALLLARISEGQLDAGRWTLPGGGLEWGEHPEAGLHRELHEETGLTGTIEGVLALDSFVLPAERRPGVEALHVIRIIYRTSCRGIPRPEVGGTTDQARWVHLGDVESLPIVDLVTVAMRAAGHP